MGTVPRGDGCWKTLRLRLRLRVVRHAKVAEGTADFRSSAAMDEDQFKRALQVGIDCVADEVATRDVKVLAIGEVGIGNTTAAAAVLTSLLGADAAECCGRGTGLDDAGLEHKVDVVRAACAFHSDPIKACGDEAASRPASSHCGCRGAPPLRSCCRRTVSPPRQGGEAPCIG